MSHTSYWFLLLRILLLHILRYAWLVLFNTSSPSWSCIFFCPIYCSGNEKAKYKNVAGNLWLTAWCSQPANEVSTSRTAASCTKAQVKYSYRWEDVIWFLIWKRILNTSSPSHLPSFVSDKKKLDNQVTYREENIYNTPESKTFSGLNGKSRSLHET